MLNIKAIAVATALAAGTVFMMPAASQAMPVAPVKTQFAQDDNVVQVKHKKKWRNDRSHWRGDRSRWRSERWRESRNWRRHRYYGRGYYNRGYYDPYYYGPRYGYYGPGYWGGGPGIGLQFRID